MSKIHKVGGSYMVASKELKNHLGLEKGDDVTIDASKFKGRKCLIVTKKREVKP